MINHALLALFIFFCALQAADTYTTYIILSRGGRELNPVMRMIMEEVGVLPGLVVCKVFLCLLVWQYGMNAILLGIFDAIYAAVVMNNAQQIYK